MKSGRMHWLTAGTLALALLGTVGSAAASTIYPFRCSACSSQQARDIAAASYQSQVYVYDLLYGQLWKFMVERDWEHGGPPMVWEVTPEAGYVETLQKWLAFYQATRGSGKAYSEISSGQLGLPGSLTAYDVAASSAVRRDVAVAISNNLNTIAGFDTGSAVSRFVTALQRAFNIVFRSDDPVVTVRVFFQDGSFAEFVLEDDDAHGEPSYDPGSAVDAHGNQVIERNSSAGAGRYRMNGNPADIAGWIDHLRGLGVTVTGPNGSIADCTWDGRTLTCSFRP